MTYFSSVENKKGEFVKVKVGSANGMSLYGELTKE